MTGADDGTVQIWRDNIDSDSTCVDGSTEVENEGLSSTTGSANISAGHPPAVGEPNQSTVLTAAFCALPDIAASSRGSGLITDWQQHAGVLAVGGNSETIRLWDVQREQCVRTLFTGMKQCTSAISCQSISWKQLGNVHGDYSSEFGKLASQMNTEGDRSQPQSFWSWIFAGFGDGSVGVFDQRVPNQGGKVHSAREDTHWIVHAAVREDIPQVITGALHGGVKFWDLRTMRVFKTIEVHKSPLTAMALHNCAPIIATGSHKQFIKILTFAGEQLSMIRYHDGFLGQRIAPVSCLAFHPHKMLLAAGSTDQIIAIYAPTVSF